MVIDLQMSLQLIIIRVTPRESDVVYMPLMACDDIDPLMIESENGESFCWVSTYPGIGYPLNETPSGHILGFVHPDPMFQFNVVWV